MIHTLHGTIAQRMEQLIIVEVNGIGYAVNVANPDMYTIGSQTQLQIYLHWNQEQGPSLYGFAQDLEKRVFEMIIGCSGIGPRIGLALLAAMSPAEFVAAIQEANEKALSSVSGIGAKKAEQIIVALKHKVAKMSAHPELQKTPVHQARHQVNEVLKSLNYSKQEISAAMNHINEEHASAALTFDQLMRQALTYLAKKT
ncbi:Holliday junction ATP-dependent DNA helicase RuvA [Candidatus Dependentiae bacterium Noda2021]|nr:Holliday junction ATP-dependent DNA helicase RuvA [Candidatus Dependentiae bacterium Noda2021]